MLLQGISELSTLKLRRNWRSSWLNKVVRKDGVRVRICNCAENCQVKYATCTLLDSALTWWNSHAKTVGIDAAYAMNWKELIKMMTKVYCPRNEIQKMENELWNLSVKGNDVVDEEEKIERYIWGLPDNIQGNVTSAGTTRLQDRIRLANILMDQRIRVIATKDADNKRKWEDEQEGNHRQQQNKRQEVVRVYIAGTGNKTGYAGTLTLCDK
ncbi:reverse transcriptase domain-containing protein [Tanacetum coccineum]